MCTTCAAEVLRIRTVDGLHELSVPMVSRRERCRFTLQPFDNTLGDLFSHIRNEDKAIDSVQAQTEGRQSSICSICWLIVF